MNRITIHAQLLTHQSVGFLTARMGKQLGFFFLYLLPRMMWYGMRLTLDHHKADSDSHAAAELLIRYMKAGVDIKKHIRTFKF